MVPLREIGFVGIGQSLDIDTVNDRFVLSGIQNGKNNSVMHTVLEGPIVDAAGSPKCGPFKLVAGIFGALRHTLVSFFLVIFRPS